MKTVRERMVFTPQKYSDVLLDLYRGAQKHPVTEFTPFAIDVIKRHIDFDMAMFGLLSREGDGKIVVHHAHLYNEAPIALDEWLAFFDKDPLASEALTKLGCAIRFHAHTHILDPELLDYVIRRRHINVLGVVLPYGPNQVRCGISLRRADSRWVYSDRDKVILEGLMPHVCEAFRINRAVFSQKFIHLTSEPVRGCCIFDDFGTIIFQDESFGHFVRMLFPDFQNFKIPEEMHTSFCRDRLPRIVVGNVVINVTKSGHLYFLSIRTQNKFDVLTDREQTVAKYYGTGLTYKEIGAELSISPSTTRRHIESIYAKLKIKTKADLSFLVHANTGSKSVANLITLNA